MRLTGDTLSDGHAQLDVRHHDKATTWISMDECRLAIDSPRWTNQAAGEKAKSATESTTSGERAAMLGIGADKRLVLRVEHSGTLRFDWSLVGRREAGGTIAFDLRLAPASLSVLHLTLPGGLIPSVDDGFASIETDGVTDGVESGSTQSGNAKSGDVRRWKIELGNHHSTLRVSHHDVLREGRPLTLARQSLVYEFSPGGMQLSADLKLDVLGDPIRRIELLVDRPLTLVTARFAGTQLAWYEADAAGHPLSHSQPNAATSAERNMPIEKQSQAEESAARRVVIELPEPLRGTAGRATWAGGPAVFPRSPSDRAARWRRFILAGGERDVARTAPHWHSTS